MQRRELIGLMAAAALVLSLPPRVFAGGPAKASRAEAGTVSAMSATVVGEATVTAPGYAGLSTCRDCHKKNVDSYLHSIHGKAQDRRTPAAQHQCESCHGPGAGHAEDPKEQQPGVRIVKFTVSSKLKVAERNAMCLRCHETMRTHVFWQGSVHQMRGLACTTCHTIHGGNHRLLSKPVLADVCFTCHKRQRSESEMAFHHPIREGQITCTDCHNPHGGIGEKLLTTATVNEKCFQCHADKRGPFVWVHPPTVESCLNCHTPHGSRHEFLLTARAPWLCQRCHSGEGHQGIMYAPNMFKDAKTNTVFATPSSVYNLRPQIYGRSCWQCHVAIHGSQSPSGNTFLR